MSTASPLPISAQSMFSPSARANAAAGQPIADLMSRALGNRDLISLAAGFVDETSLPTDAVRVATEHVLQDPVRARAALQYGSNAGLPLLRERILERMCLSDDLAHRGIGIDQLVVTSGSNQLLSLLADVLLDPGDIALCAAPTYLVWTGIVKGVRGRSIGVATDEFGMMPQALEARLADLDAQGELHRVKILYLVPYFDNPRGVTMPSDRRAAIVDIAKRWSKAQPIHVISDNAYRELRYRGEDVADTIVNDEDGDTVIVASTFSKSFAPGIRLGYGVLPRHLVGPILDVKSNIDFGSPNLNQHVMAEVMECGLYDQQLRAMRDCYRVKLEATLDAAETYLGDIEKVTWERPAGGLYVWVTLPEQLDTGSEGALFAAALDEGMFYVPGECCFANEGEPIQHHSMRLSFGAQSPERIREGVAALARAIHRVTDNAWT